MPTQPIPIDLPKCECCGEPASFFIEGTPMCFNAWSQSPHYAKVKIDFNNRVSDDDLSPGP
jgi:hypothetical protein